MSIWFIKLHTCLNVLFYFSIKKVEGIFGEAPEPSRRETCPLRFGVCQTSLWGPGLWGHEQGTRGWLHLSRRFVFTEPIRSLALLLGEVPPSREGPKLLVLERGILGQPWGLSVSSAPFLISTFCTFVNLWILGMEKVGSYFTKMPLRYFFLSQESSFRYF